MKCAKDFRADSRAALKFNWPGAVLTGFVAGLFGAGIMYSVNSGNSASASASGTESAIEDTLVETLAQFPVLLGILGVVVSVLGILAVISIVIGGAMTLGYASYNLNLIDGKPARFGDLFSQLNRLGQGFVMRLLIFVFTLLWSLLLVVPGIVAAFSYSMTPYILYENPDMRPREAIAASKELMKGNKWRLFCLSLSFFGWCLLAALTLGIGSLFLRPYVETAGAAFYREIQAERYGSHDKIYGNYTVL